MYITPYDTYNVEKIKQQLSEKHAHALALFKAWTSIKRVTKKDGTDFVRFAANFTDETPCGLVIKQPRFSGLEGQFEISVYTRDELHHSAEDYITNYKPLSYYANAERTEAERKGLCIMNPGGFWSDYILYNPDQTYELIKERAEYWRRKAEEYSYCLENFDQLSGALGEMYNNFFEWYTEQPSAFRYAADAVLFDN